MSEIFRSRSENNKILKSLPQCKIAFECKQKRLSNDRFWNNYEQANKHERMRCLLCVSGLSEVPPGLGFGGE